MSGLLGQNISDSGAVADVLLEPYLAIVLGLVGGVASTLGFIFLPDWVTFSLRSSSYHHHHLIIIICINIESSL